MERNPYRLCSLWEMFELSRGWSCRIPNKICESRCDLEPEPRSAATAPAAAEILRSTHAIEHRKGAGLHVEQILPVRSDLLIFAHRNVGHVLPKLHLKFDAD